MCSNPEHAWYPQRTVCYSTAAAAAAKTLYRLKHEKAPWHNGSWTSFATEASKSHPYHYDAGVEVWVSEYDLTPDDDFLNPRPATGGD